MQRCSFEAMKAALFVLRSATIVAAMGAGSLAAAANEPTNTTPQEVFDGMRQSFRAEKAKGVHLKYQWQLSGPQGGEWWIEVNDGKFQMGRGKIDNPDVTFVTSDKNWVALSNGTLGGKWAFFTGRLKIRGSQSAARKLDEIFP
jgi:putative sterol carrier protein